MIASPNKSLLECFYHWEATQPDAVYFYQPINGQFVEYTWKEVGRQARSIAAYLKSLGLSPKSNIGLVSKNCAEWLITDLAIMLAGHVSVPFYPTLVRHQIRQVLEHSECKYLFVGKLDDLEEVKKGIPDDVTCISFPTYNPDPSHIQWDDLLNSFKPLDSNYYPDLNDLFTIIYTSGTTGNPKGVMMQYKVMSEVLYHTRGITKLDIPNVRFFSYLPLCHIAERNIIEAGSLVTGGTVYFAENLDTFSQNLQTAQPTHFLAVPRIWTKFQLGILAKLSQKKLNLLLSIPVVSGLIKNKIKKGLGLDKAVVTLTGAAPMPISLIQWFRRLGITIQEAYGMTENTGAVCMMPFSPFKDGSVGKVYPEMEVKISPVTGEILTRSPWQMVGYYKEPEMTAEVLTPDGWLHTGDVGELDTDGFLKITGRVKEMYKTTKGEYIAPAQIEFNFADNHFIEQICVVGQNLPQPIALIVLSELGLKTDKLHVKESLLKTLTEVNPLLKTYEKVRKIVVMPTPWTVENNKLTPTLKIKRNVIETEFNHFLEKWYDHHEEVVWE